tara:strand:+ start:6030 stop:7052 length:1023 start_codon:yes stop_codon:yes gene_type:complete
MEVSAQSLARIATERQFQPATLERVIRLLDILGAIAADSLIAPRIALKGGTALNVFHAALDRLSVDIDLNYVGAVDRASMDEDRPGLEDRILRLMESKGYSPRREPAEHAGGKWIFRYASVLGGAGSIEIDINYLFRTPLFGVRPMPSVALGDTKAMAVPVLDIHEIVAGKLVALIARRTARDLFDAHRIIAMPDLDWSKVKLGTLMIGASARSLDWRTASVDMIGCDGKDLAAKLITCLPGTYFDPYGGQKGWIDTVTAECRQGLEPLFQFGEGEMAFLTGVLEEGIIDANRLDAPEDVRAAIEACPALRWKAQNVKAWKTGGALQAKRGRRRRHRHEE